MIISGAFTAYLHRFSPLMSIMIIICLNKCVRGILLVNVKCCDSEDCGIGTVSYIGSKIFAALLR